MWWVILGVFAGIVLLSLTTFIAQCLAVRRNGAQNLARWPVVNRQRSVACGLSPELMSRLPTTKLDGEAAEGRTEEDAECVVCQEEMEVGALVTHLPCKHGFHAACAQQWLSRQPTCPTCRLLLNNDNLGPPAGGDLEMGPRPPDAAGWSEVPLQPIPAEMDKQPAGLQTDPYPYPHPHPSTIMPIVNPMSTSQRDLHAAI